MISNITRAYVILGIDPGKSGGIALLADFQDNKLLQVWPYSDKILQKVFEWYHVDAAFLESVHAMPGQGVTSMFNFGKAFGYILGALEANGVKAELVRPQEWKKVFDLIGKDKQASIDKAKKLFPKMDLHRTKRCRKEHDGMAEALLIMEYGRRKIYAEEL